MLLVTTPLESTWGADEDIMFLGEWCKLYSRKEIWSKRNYEVLPYHWDDRVKLKKDFFNLQNFNKKIIKELTHILNELHNVKENEHYWGILLGYWVNIFTAVIFDRWTMIDKAVESNKITKCHISNVEENNLAANETSDFIDSVINDSWNQAIYTIIIKLTTNIPVEIIKKDQISKSETKNKQKKSYFKQVLSKVVFNKFTCFSKNNDALIINSYLPIIEELKLQLSLRQFPIIRNFKKVKAVEVDNSFRNWELKDRKPKDNFHEIIKYLLPKLLPKIYLENYKNLVSTVKKTSLPKSPKFIFTASSHYDNSIFLEYAAKSNNLGSKLILADHGGFGCNAFNGAISYQLSVADVSLSWGWQDKDHINVRPFGILKTIGKNQTWDNNGLGLMVLGTMPRYSFDIRAMPIAGQMNDYFTDQFDFYGSLPESIKKKILIRLYQGDLGWDQKKRWQDKFRNVLIDSGKLSINNLLKKCRLFISTYNATTFMETLSLNVPTIMFWNINNWEIHDRAKKCFKELEEVGIFHATPQSAALKVTEIWDNVPGWWNQEETQKARTNFCNNFAKEVKNPIKELTKKLITTNNE
ncbi:putative transferase (TIGR04331 family) [Lutibacter sp. Hel_I_33_5]|uniref:LIC12162 family transferase n=1 Tax=Lutibacter sp. Hel_I_33_5 TaxID=1566289 RepID=UPI00119F1D64|nr:LIC12162 family protein [Lutibacter sp. Hel_I_33_5]TVZ55505.1 putative transferase (TIGR04331 family) [Lutibacter sp. Hel_I_33_5]